MATSRELLAQGAARLTAVGVASPDVDAELLLAHVTGTPRALLRLSGGSVTTDQEARYDDLIDRRARRMPLQHLTGSAPFRHLDLFVGPGVFIPRPETELLVDVARDHLSGQRSPLVVDLCTGSGALALAIALEVPGSRVVAVEVSEEAMRWAKLNRSAHEGDLARAGSTVDLVRGDATSIAEPGGRLRRWRGLVDLVVTNPPYVPDDAVPRDPEVRDHDPHLALYGGEDGLEVVRPLAGQAAMLLRPGGMLLVEHADVQGEEAGEAGVPALLRAQRERASNPARSAADHGRVAATVWQDVADHLDLAGRPRYTSATRRTWG